MIEELVLKLKTDYQDKSSDNVNRRRKKSEEEKKESEEEKKRKDFRKLVENLLKTGMPYNIRRVSDVLFKYMPPLVSTFAAYKILKMIYNKISELSEMTKEYFDVKKNVMFSNYITYGDTIMKQDNINKLLNSVESSEFLRGNKKAVAQDIEKIQKSGRKFRVGLQPDTKLETALAYFGKSSAQDVDEIIGALIDKANVFDKEGRTRLYEILSSGGVENLANAILENKRLEDEKRNIANIFEEQNDLRQYAKIVGMNERLAKIDETYAKLSSETGDLKTYVGLLKAKAWSGLLYAPNKIINDVDEQPELLMDTVSQHPANLLPLSFEAEVQRRNNGTKITQAINNAVANEFNIE